MLFKAYVIGLMPAAILFLATVRPAYRAFLIERDERRIRFVKEKSPSFSPSLWYAVAIATAIAWPLVLLSMLNSFLMGLVFLHDTGKGERDAD